VRRKTPPAIAVACAVAQTSPRTDALRAAASQVPPRLQGGGSGGSGLDRLNGLAASLAANPWCWQRRLILQNRRTVDRSRTFTSSDAGLATI
jgi:hypothetical protein